jgi:lysophospholipase L1-like esterase
MADLIPSERYAVANDAGKIGSSSIAARPVTRADYMNVEDATDNTVRVARVDDVFEDTFDVRGGNWFPNPRCEQRCFYHKNIYHGDKVAISIADYETPYSPYAIKIVPTGVKIQAYLTVNPSDYGADVTVGDEWMVSMDVKGEGCATPRSIMCMLMDDATQASFTQLSTDWRLKWTRLTMPPSTIGTMPARLQLFIYGDGYTGDGSEAIYLTNIVFCKASNYRYNLRNLRWEEKFQRIRNSGWYGKKLAVYGDSISDTYTTHLANKHNLKWIGRVVEECGFSHYYNRAKGGTRVRLDDDRDMWVNSTTGESCESGDTGAKLINGAMCGDDRINTIPPNTDLVIIFAGANDGSVLDGTELGTIDDDPAEGTADIPASFYASYMIMLEKIYERCGDGVQILLLGMTYQKAADLGTAPNYYALRRKAIADIAELYGLPYLDLKANCQMNRYNSLPYVGVGNGDDELYYDSGDNNIHLSSYGDAMVSAAVLGKLRQFEPVAPVSYTYGTP